MAQSRHGNKVYGTTWVGKGPVGLRSGVAALDLLGACFNTP